jgi:hypothetical protein
MAYDLFDSRTMMAAMEQAKPPRTFLLNTFFGGAPRTFDTEAVDIDIIKGKRRLAPFVNPRREGKVVEKRGFKTRSYKPAYIKPKMVTTAEDIMKRAPGQHIYAPNSGPAVKAAQELGRNLAELNEMITRREEWMAAMSLTTGKCPIIGEGVDDLVDFLMDGTHLPVLSGNQLWTDHDDAKPLQDLRRWKRLVAKDSGMSPSIAIMGLDAIDNFLQCDEVVGTTGGRKSLFDMINVSIGRIDPQMLPDGVTYYGLIKELGLEIYTYEEWYVDDESDIESPMIPANKVLLGNPNARTERMYGAIKDLSALAAVPRFPKSWTVEDPSARFVMLQSAPLMAPLQVDAFLCATVTQ